MIKPTVTYELFGGQVEVLIYGKSPHDLTERDLIGIARNLGLKHVYQPQTHTFNAKICSPFEFTKENKVGGVTIHSGCLADGVKIVSQGDAVWLRTADCPTIIAYHSMEGGVVVAHAGRASLIDESHLRTDQVKRQPESIVQAIYQELIDLFRSTSVYLDVYSCGGIGPKYFCHPIDHPEYGSFNQKMNHHIALHYSVDCFLDGKLSNGALDLHRLIKNQFQFCGIPGDNIHHDFIDTAGQNDSFFSRRGGDKTGHNTILVIRRA